MPYLIVAVVLAVVIALVTIGCRSQRSQKPAPASPTPQDQSEPMNGVRAKVEPLKRNSIRLLPATAPKARTTVGESRIGGRPDLPSGVEWPSWAKGRLSFIAQVRLNDAAPHDREGLLPKTGMLYFFYDSKEQPWGFDPADKGCARVIYWNGDLSTLKLAEWPADLDTNERFEGLSLSLQPESILPDPSSTQVDGLGLSEAESEDYTNLFDESGQTQHRLLGYPQIVQNPMELECQLASNGIYVGDSNGYRDSRASELSKGASDWQLLLQIDSDDAAKMMWGDVGRIYFWIRRQDLADRKFENVWLILQCY